MEYLSRQVIDIDNSYLLLSDSHDLLVSTPQCALCMCSTSVTHSLCTLHALKPALGGSNKGVVLNDLALVFRFGVIFKKHFKGKFSKSNEHLWQHINVEIDDFQMPTYERDTGVPIDVLRTGSHPHMLLYVLNELFYVYRGVGENDVDRQRVVAYEILTVASIHCMEQHGSQKKECHTFGLLTQG